VVPALVISGPVGVGKSSVAAEVGGILAGRGVAHAVVDLDALTAAFPRPADDPFGSRLAMVNLRDVWRNAAAAGARNLVIARVIESPEDVEAIQAAVDGGPVVVCRLRAAVATLQERVRRRESGSGLAWHLERAAELGQRLERGASADCIIDTDTRTVEEVAAELVDRVAWRV
jgi:hypothetical protein